MQDQHDHGGIAPPPGTSPQQQVARPDSLDLCELKNAQDALRDSDAQFKKAQEIAHLGSWELDLVRDRLTWSDEVYRIFGLQPQEFGATYEAFLEAVHPEDRARVDAAYSGSLHEGRDSYEIEHRVVRRSNGEVRVVHEKCEHFRDGTGRIVRSVGMVHDITERALAEQALRESEERFRSLAEGLPQLIYATDAQGRPVYHNARWSEYTGQPPAGRGHYLCSIHPDDVQHLRVCWNEALRTGAAFRHEHRIRSRSGAYRWFLSRAWPLRNAAGDVTRWFGTATDIDELKQTEQALERSRLGLSRLAGVSLAVMRETDLDGMLKAVSEAALALTGARIAICGHGYGSGSFVVNGAARVAGGPDCPAGSMFLLDKGGVHMALVEGAAGLRLSDEQLRAHPQWWGLPEGHVPIRGLLGVPIPGHNGQSSGMILATDKEHGEFTAEDESLLRQLATVASLALQHVQARISLEEADRRKNEFLSMLSHELRNPLAPIRNSLFILERAAPGSDQALRARKVIDRQTAHLTLLVDELLDVTRISRGMVNLQRESLDLGELLRVTLEDHRFLFESSAVELSLTLADAPLRINGDRTRVAQVIGNLLQNAAKFTPAGGRVAASLEADTRLRQAVLRVCDTGVGIGADMLPLVFEPFAQADTTLDRQQGGLGLGLALVKGLVEMHEGTVSAASPGLGEGAEFVVRLPLQPAAQ